MSFLPWKRKSPRLTGYDYSQEGAYFVTVCIQRRECLLGRVVEGILQLNDAGKMVEKWWLKLESKFPLTKVDPFHVVMPNHFHGIVFKLSEAPEGAHMGAPLQKADTPLQEIVQWFKTMTTNEYIHGVKNYGWKPFRVNLWQRGFFDHVIRNDESLNRIRDYIANNPGRWDKDRENPRAKGTDDFDRWLATFKTRPLSSDCRGAPVCAPTTFQELGDAGEDLAAAALKKQGYKILERNWRSPLGEVDLVARHGQYLVLVEVKTRRSDAFGGPREAVSPAKQAKLRRLADYYIREKRLGEDVMVRFDVVGITLGEAGPRVEIIPHAFG